MEPRRGIRANPWVARGVGTDGAEPADWRWLVRQIRAAGTSSVRASTDWQWVTFRRDALDLEVRQIVRLPVDDKFTVTRYDPRSQVCEIVGDYPDAQTALSVALA